MADFFVWLTCEPLLNFQNESTGTFVTTAFPFVPDLHKTANLYLTLLEANLEGKPVELKGNFVLSCKNMVPNLYSSGFEMPALALLSITEENVSIKHSFPGKFVPDCPNAHQVYFSLVNVQDPNIVLKDLQNTLLILLLKIGC